MKRYLVMLVAFVMLYACQSQSIHFTLEKDGLLYNDHEMVTFYYPRDWELTKDELKMSLDIVNQSEQEALYYDVFDVEESNLPSELVSLYEAKLKDLGLEVISVKESTLDNGQDCFMIEGKIKKNQASFIEVVVYVGNKQYIYSYIASDEVFESNSERMVHYLESLTINEAMKSAL